MTDNPNYVRNLELQIGRYMTILETNFGRRDPRFVLESLKKSSGPPKLHFPNTYSPRDGCVVEIQISEWPWENQSSDQGPWQVAHECVHLLDPAPYGSVNVLEEGLATWFQDEPQFHDDAVRNYIEQGKQSHAPNYLEARNLVRHCMIALTT